MEARSPASDLERRTLEFTVQTSEELKAGDTLIIRRVSPRPDGLRVAVVPEKAVRDAVAELLG